ncbi:MAG: sulfatase [Bryobacteraceae bacterium]
MTISRRSFVAAAAAGAVTAQPRRPNILYILMDDLGWPSIGAYGNKLVPTPNLDRLARDGMKFTQAYVTPQCTPTRATLLSGQYTARNRMWHVIPPYGLHWAKMREPRFRDQFPRDAFTLAKGLRSAGYTTACIGKWHLTNGPDGNYAGLRQEAARHYGFDVTSKPAPRPDELRTADKGVDRLTSEAIAFIEENRERPFFCYLPHHTIHGPVVAPESKVAAYRAKGFPEEGLNNANYLAAIEHFDTAVGRLLARLDDLRLRDSTAVFFVSDNGGVARSFQPNPAIPPGGAPIRLEEGWRAFSNEPLRAMKGSAYEGGIRVPMIVRWPGRVRPGSVCDTPVHIVDTMPTLFAMAGARAPEGYVQDGADIGPLLAGRRMPERALYWYMPFYDLRWGATPSAVIREGRYKLIESFGDYVDLDTREYVPKPRIELFDLDADRGERIDLAARQPARARAMQAKLRQWIAASGAEVPGPNPHYDPKRALEEARGFPPWSE